MLSKEDWIRWNFELEPEYFTVAAPNVLGGRVLERPEYRDGMKRNPGFGHHARISFCSIYQGLLIGSNNPILCGLRVLAHTLGALVQFVGLGFVFGNYFLVAGLGHNHVVFKIVSILGRQGF